MEQSDKKFTREEVMSGLLAGCTALRVTFKKVSSGDTRVMECTLNSLYIPASAKAAIYRNNPSKKEPSPDVICAFSLDDNGWRSFRLDSILKVEACEFGD